MDAHDSDASVSRAGEVATGTAESRTPNELGRIPVLEYHVIGGREGMFTRPAAKFRAPKSLTLLGLPALIVD